MVVRKGREWGVPGRPDGDLPTAESDSEAAKLFTRGIGQIVLAGGDMARTVGALPVSDSSSFTRFSMDVLELHLRTAEDRDETAIALSHCVIRQPWLRGAFLSGGITVLCNAQFIERRDVAPRGHPNDGRFEVLHFSQSLTCRQRLQILKRMKSGDHLPHPSISFHQVARLEDIDCEGVVFIDGVRFRGVRVLGAVCIPDALDVWVASAHHGDRTEPPLA